MKHGEKVCIKLEIHELIRSSFRTTIAIANNMTADRIDENGKYMKIMSKCDNIKSSSFAGEVTPTDLFSIFVWVRQKLGPFHLSSPIGR